MAVFRFFILGIFSSVFLLGCISTELRMPSSISEVYSNKEMKQSLLLAAQNKVLFHFPTETLSETEKTEIDLGCRQFQSPMWAEKLSIYLNIFRSRPELFSKFHVIEIKKGDSASVRIQNDMDQISVLEIHYVKSENRGKVIQSTRLPCQGSLAGYIGREIIKTEFEFPQPSEVQAALERATERKESARFDFSTDFLSYLAERGMLFKFSHELSFEKLPNGKFVMAELMNEYSQQIREHEKMAGPQRLGANSHLNLWIKKINENSKQAELIQFFSVENDRQLKTGIKVEGEKEVSKKKSGSMDLTYLFTSYHIENEKLQLVSLQNLNQCLQTFSNDSGRIFFRGPSSESERSSYLAPGFVCKNSP